MIEACVDDKQNCAATVRVLVNSMPKAGTFLLRKTIQLLAAFEYAQTHIDRTAILAVPTTNTPLNQNVLVGVDFPQSIDLSVLKNICRDIKLGTFATAHLPFSPAVACMLDDLAIVSSLILRDPRDIVVSHAKFVIKHDAHFLHSYYTQLSEDARIEASIMGVPSNAGFGFCLLNIAERLDSMLPWIQHPTTYTTFFERLVGAAGGGSHDRQLEEVRRIAHHFKLDCSDRHIVKVAEQIFGGTLTFHQGTIGAWRTHFTLRHKQLFKDIAGHALIELGYERNFNW